MDAVQIILAILAACAFLLFVPAPPVQAGSDETARVRAAVRSGEIAPLENVLKAVRRELDAQVIEIELDDDDGRWIYKVKLLAPDGRVVKLEYDARTLALLKRKGAGIEDARPR